MTFTPPDTGFIFWPVACGDSTTIVVDSDTVIQVDLHHLEDAEDDDHPCAPIVDVLIDDVLPTYNGEPYLAAFGATHLDKDHVLGFRELLKRATIGDLWFTPRVLWEQDELCDDAKAFVEEVKRRIGRVKELGDVESGDRIRIIGFHDVLKKKSAYQGLPDDVITVPGSSFTEIDGVDRGGDFRAFVHAPFKEDAEKERNDTSFGIQISLFSGEGAGRAMILGDLKYPTVKRIFEYSDEGDVAWNVFLAPHHCANSVMYWRDEGEDKPTLRRDVLDEIEDAAGSPGYIVASAPEIPSSNDPGDNPPHAKAAARYREIAPDGFLCTGEEPDPDAPEPLVFEVTNEGCARRAMSEARKADGSLSDAVRSARGGDQPPRKAVGFGHVDS